MRGCSRFALIAVCLAVTGCAMGPVAAPSPDAGVAIRGVVHGGQQGIVGAHVYLFAANTTGYGGAGLAASTSNASVSLLNTADAGVYSDSVGAYVLTGAGGSTQVPGR